MTIRTLSALILCSMCSVMLAGPKREADLARIKQHFAQRGENWTWVFYGDSITHGAVHTHGWRSFQEIFQERVRTEYGRTWDVIINSGNSGQTSLELVNDKQYDWQVRHHKPQVVLLLIGCNDIVRPNCGGVEDFRGRLTKLVELIRADGAIPVLQTYNTIQLVENPTNDYLKGYVKRYHEFPAYNQAIREVAQEQDTILVDHRKHWEQNAADPDELDFWLGETIHPGAYGHQQMAILIFKELGMYSPSSKCCTLAAGGPRPVRPAVSEAAVRWIVNYQADRDGVFPAAQWESGYPAGTAEVKDGYLRLDHTNPSRSPMAKLRNTEALRDAKTLVLEITYRVPPQEKEAGKPYQLWLGATAEYQGQIAEVIVMLNENTANGSIPARTFPGQPGDDITLKFVLDVSSGMVVCSCNGKEFANVVSKRLSKEGPRVQLGDGGTPIAGILELRSLKVGVVR